MREFGLLGYPLGHTLSPPIHRALFSLSGQAGSYRVYEAAPARLAAQLPALKRLCGFNVTIPYKVELLPHMDALDDTALRYGALNVVARGPDGRCTGYNTDCYGFRKAIDALGANLGSSVCVLGAGGAGRMFAIEAALCGAEVTLAVRESSRAAAEQVRVEILAHRPAAIVHLADIATLRGSWQLLIHATPVGMYPNQNVLPISPALLAGCTYVFDAIYNPTPTLLLQRAAQAGCKTAGGMAMLVWQAVKAHEIWDGATYQPAAIAALIAELELNR